ncbi:hypothetical protein RSAG8_09393, partial [Rhizoctonia solani AG-8 WAC10335]
MHYSDPARLYRRPIYYAPLSSRHVGRVSGLSFDHFAVRPSTRGILLVEAPSRAVGRSGRGAFTRA